MKYRHYSPRAPVHIFEGAAALAAAVRLHLEGGGGGEPVGGGAGSGETGGGGAGGRAPWLGVMAPGDVLRQLVEELPTVGGVGSGLGQGLDECVMVKCGEDCHDAESIARGLFGKP